MNNAAADVEIMPAVVWAQYSLWYLRPPYSFISGGKRDTCHAGWETRQGDSWPNKRDLRFRSAEEEEKGKEKKEKLKIKRDGGSVTDGGGDLYLDMGGGERWAGRQASGEWDGERRVRRRAEVGWDWQSETERGARDAEKENCGKSSRRIGLVMRRVYQLFRCRLLIKHHQTLNLLTINTLLHYRAIPFFFFSSFISLFLFLFPSGSLCLSLPLCRPLLPSLFSLYQTPPTQARLTI